MSYCNQSSISATSLSIIPPQSTSSPIRDSPILFIPHKPLTQSAADPLFAFAIGSSAALLRIRREEKEKHPKQAAEIGIGSVLSTGGDRMRRWWAGDFDGNAPPAKQ
ncbi:hypothetical protein BJX70DRAFT_398348 [Aspergillus crustosus]